MKWKSSFSFCFRLECLVEPSIVDDAESEIERIVWHVQRPREQRVPLHSECMPGVPGTRDRSQDYGW